MSAHRPTGRTSPGKGEVDREAIGRGSRFARTKSMTVRARHLRGEMTNAEEKLWRALRRGQLGGLQFRRQHPIGPFTLDFYCSRLKLAIEVDGGQHADKQKPTDQRRTRFLEEHGIAVIRYWNNDILSNLDGCLIDLLQQIDIRRRLLTPTPTLPLLGGGSEQHSDAAPTSPGKGEVDREAVGRGSGRSIQGRAVASEEKR